jgi:DNA-binding CsgD family transcriptional regulator
LKLKISILFFFLAIASFSQNEVFFLKDTSSLLTKETVQNASFKIVEYQILEKHTKATYWFKIPAHQTESEYIFRIIYERIKKADVYQNSKKIKSLQQERYLSYQFSREADVYIKVQPELHSYIPFELNSVENSNLREKNQLIINGFYYGFAFLVIIYNLFYFLLFKDDTFLYYSLFLGSMSFGVFIMDGMLDFYSLSTSTINFCMILNYIFLAFFTSKFANSYLFLEVHYPKLKKFTYPIGISVIVLGVLFLIQDKYPYLLLIFINIFVFSLMIIYWSTAVLLFKYNIYTKILVFAYVIILLSGIDFFILKFLGISFINITPVNIKIGAFLEMIILSIAVLYRMKALKEENKYMRSEIVNYSKQISLLSKTKREVSKSNLDDLSFREREIFDLIILGNTNKEIANNLNISINTVKFHVKNIYEKLNIKSRKEALNLGITAS